MEDCLSPASIPEKELSDAGSKNVITGEPINQELEVGSASIRHRMTSSTLKLNPNDLKTPSYFTSMLATIENKFKTKDPRQKKMRLLMQRSSAVEDLGSTKKNKLQKSIK